MSDFPADRSFLPEPAPPLYQTIAWITVPEAARRLGGVSRQRVHQLIDRGALDVVRFPAGPPLVRAASVARLLQERAASPRRVRKS